MIYQGQQAKGANIRLGGAGKIVEHGRDRTECGDSGGASEQRKEKHEA